METGISIYLSVDEETNRQIIEKAAKQGMRYAFTSLQIPEEDSRNQGERITRLLSLCRQNHICLMADAGQDTAKRLGLGCLEELAECGLTHLRLDYGFTAEETVTLSKTFFVVLNASTVTDQEIALWKSLGADMGRFIACHNFYPKPYTGLSMERVRRINDRMHGMGISTMAFVPGNLTLRGPLYEGLPTVEEQRAGREQVLLNILKLHQDGAADIVLIGDVDIRPEDWNRLKCLNDGYVKLRARLDPEYGFAADMIHHDRADSSDYVFRSVESRNGGMCVRGSIARGGQERPTGSICLSNEGYLRYMGELEIARTDLPPDDRVTVIGQIEKEDMKYLPYIQEGLGIRLSV